MKKVHVEIDTGAGYCFGVKEVVEKAESLLGKGMVLYGLGEMVHNSNEVTRLRNMGLRTVDHRDLSRLHAVHVLFRAHGEPPSSYETARRNKLEIIDGTCPIVRKLQERIRKTYAEMDRDREQLVFYGKKNHPEILGLLGQVNGDAVVVEKPDDLEKVEATKGIRLFSQTTMDPDGFKAVEERLHDRLTGPGELPAESHCTICGQMKKRKPGLRSFARKHDLILFVSGKHSSNGRMLYEYCALQNSRTYWVEGADDLELSWFGNLESVGISGATSTSRLQLEAVKNRVDEILSMRP